MRSNSPNSGRRSSRIAGAVAALLVFVFLSGPLYAGLGPRVFREEPPTRDKERLRQIVEGVARAYGGQETLRSIKSVYARGTISPRLRGEKGRYEHSFQRPGRLRVDIQYEHTQERMLLIGERGWSAQGGGPFVDATAYASRSMLYQYHELDLPMALIEGRYSAVYLGEADLGGRDAYMLGVEAGHGLRFEVFVDMQSSLIVKVKGRFNLKKIRVYITSEYSDFRWVGDTVLPHRILNYGSARRMGETLIEEYRINPRIDEEAFKP